MTRLYEHSFHLTPTPAADLPSGDLGDLVDVKRVTDVNGYPFALMATNPDDADNGTVHMHVPWSESLIDRLDAGPRYTAVAQAMARRAVVFDMPGMGVDAPALPRTVMRELMNGNSRGIATMQWEAYQQAFPEAPTNQTLGGFGASLGGTTLGAHIAMAPEGVTFDSLVFYESAGLSHASLLGLCGGFAMDTIMQSKRAAAYRCETPGDGPYVVGSGEHTSTFARALRKNPAHYAAYPQASAKGHVEHDIWAAYNRGTLDDTTEIVFVTGRDSHVSTLEDNYKAAKFLSKKIGVHAIHVVSLLGENHAMYDSTPRMHDIVRRVNDQILSAGA